MKITPVLEKLEKVDALILGSPIYFGTITGEMKSFLERAAYSYLTYTVDRASLFPKKIRPGSFIPWGRTNRMKEMQIDRHMMVNQMIHGRHSARRNRWSPRTRISSMTIEVRAVHDPVAKAKRRQEVFPQDCQRRSRWAKVR